MLNVMTPLWGTKHSSAPVGDKSGGDRRAARSPLSCALWSGMGGYGAAWAATVPRAGNTAFPVHRPSDISSGANQALQPWFSRNTKHETRITAFTAARTTSPADEPLLLCSRLFAIVRHCSAKNIAPEPVSPLRPHRQRGLYGPSRDTSYETRFSPSLRRLQGEQPQARPTGFSRNTRHETRITAFTLPFPRFPTISHDFPAFPGPPTPPPPIKCPRAVRLSWSAARDCRAARLLLPARCGAVMERHERHIAPEPVSAHRQPQFPHPSGFVLLRLMPNETMLSRGNVMDCVDGSCVCIDTLEGRAYHIVSFVHLGGRS